MKKDPPDPPSPSLYSSSFCLQMRERGGGAAITEGSICASVNVWKVGGEVEEGGTFTFNSSRSDSGEGLVYRRGSR